MVREYVYADSGVRIALINKFIIISARTACRAV
jgi:hypothetical protein